MKKFAWLTSALMLQLSCCSCVAPSHVPALRLHTRKNSLRSNAKMAAVAPPFRCHQFCVPMPSLLVLLVAGASASSSGSSALRPAAAFVPTNTAHGTLFLLSPRQKSSCATAISPTCVPVAIAAQTSTRLRIDQSDGHDREHYADHPDSALCDDECEESYFHLDQTIHDVEQNVQNMTERLLETEAVEMLQEVDFSTAYKEEENGAKGNEDDEDDGLTEAEVAAIEAEFAAADAERVRAEAEFRRLRAQQQQREMERSERVEESSAANGIGMDENGNGSNGASASSSSGNDNDDDFLRRIQLRNRLARERLEAEQAEAAEKAAMDKIKTKAEKVVAAERTEEVAPVIQTEDKKEVKQEEATTSTIDVIATKETDDVIDQDQTFKTLRDRLDHEQAGFESTKLSTPQRYLMREHDAEARTSTGSFGMIPVIKKQAPKSE